MTTMDVVPTNCSASSPSYHMSNMNNMNKMNNTNVNMNVNMTMNATNSKRGAQHVPPLTGFSGGLPKNMDLHSQYERLALLGQRSHSALFGSTSSVWRLSSHSKFPSSSPSASSSDTLSSDTHPHTTTSFATTPHQQVNYQGEPGNEQNSPQDEYPHAAADEDEDDDNNNDNEEEDGEEEEEDDNTRAKSRKVQQYKYQYRHIFSNSTSAPASTPHHPHFFEFSFDVMTGPDRTNDSSSASSSYRANPLAAPNQPPRPPNAWILYRSDKLKNIPSPPPGAPKRPQAEVSKMISQMWKLESADVRSHYERLSEIKKAEHQAMYPGYRFQPMKKEDKDRIRAEKQAEKEREREARKASRKTRQTAASSQAAPAEVYPPLFTNQARALPSSVAAVPNAVPNDMGPPQAPPGSITASSSSSGPPGDLPTPPGDNDGCTPPSLPSQSQSFSSSSDALIATAPPLLAPRPTPVPQCPPSPSAWHEPGPVSNTTLPPSSSLPQQDTPFSLDSIPTWFDSSLFLPDPPSDANSYITVALPSQQPLGWSPDDPGPLSDMHLSFFDQPSTSQQQQHSALSIKTTGLPSNIPSNLAHVHTQAQSNPPPPPLTATASTSLTPVTTTVSPDQLQLHAVVAATNDPDIFALDFDFANNELFDGTREIQVSMAPGMLLSSAFGDFGGNNGNASGHANDDFASLLGWDSSNFSGAIASSSSGINYPYSTSYPTGDVDFSLPLGLNLGIDMDMDGMDTLNASGAMSLPPPPPPPPPPPSDMVGMIGPNGSSSFSSMISTTPSATSANTSQTSLHPTPPPPWSASTRDEREGATYQKGDSNSNIIESDPAQQQQYQQSAPTTMTTPYVPPAGAIHSSTRRVAADWRRIRAMTPDPEHGFESGSRQDSNP